MTTWPWAARNLTPLLRRAFAGPDLAVAWLREARPASLDGRTPLEAIAAGDESQVRQLLEHLLMGA